MLYNKTRTYHLKRHFIQLLLLQLPLLFTATHPLTHSYTEQLQYNTWIWSSFQTLFPRCNLFIFSHVASQGSEVRTEAVLPAARCRPTGPQADPVWRVGSAEPGQAVTRQGRPWWDWQHEWRLHMIRLCSPGGLALVLIFSSFPLTGRPLISLPHNVKCYRFICVPWKAFDLFEHLCEDICPWMMASSNARDSLYNLLLFIPYKDAPTKSSFLDLRSV